jgi:hypothetical protein
MADKKFIRKTVSAITALMAPQRRRPAGGHTLSAEYAQAIEFL